MPFCIISSNETNFWLLISRFMSGIHSCRSFHGTFHGINDSAKRFNMIRQWLYAVIRINAARSVRFYVHCHHNDFGRRSSRKSHLGRFGLSSKKYVAVVYKRRGTSKSVEDRLARAGQVNSLYRSRYTHTHIYTHIHIHIYIYRVRE